jgi:hypothetical protein
LASHSRHCSIYTTASPEILLAVLAVDDCHVTFSEYNSSAGLTKPGEVGDFFALVSMKSPNFCQKAKF